MTAAVQFDDLSFPEYLEIPAANSSSLKTLLTHSPRTMREQVSKATAAMSLGTMVHALTLTPDTWQDEIAVKPAGCDKRSTAGKTILRDWLTRTCGDDMALDIPDGLAAGKALSLEIMALEAEIARRQITVCSEDDLEKARAIRDAILAHPICRVLFAGGQPEVTMLATDPATSIPCKARLDWMPDGHCAIVDLKTAEDASWGAFSRACAQYEYHLQAALYRRVYGLVTGETPAFLHVTVQTLEPFEVAVYELDAEALAAGEARADRALSIWQRCVDANFWPGAGWDWDAGEYTIESLSLPKWAMQ